MIGSYRIVRVVFSPKSICFSILRVVLHYDGCVYICHVRVTAWYVSSFM